MLESLSTGVVSLDENDLVTTINAAASRILRLRAAPPSERKLEQLMGSEDWLVLDRLLRRARRTGQASEQAQLAGPNDGTAEGASLPVALTATALRASLAQKRGVVLVLEDLRSCWRHSASPPERSCAAHGPRNQEPTHADPAFSGTHR